MVRPILWSIDKTGANWVLAQVKPFCAVVVAAAKLCVPSVDLPDGLFVRIRPISRAERFPIGSPSLDRKMIGFCGRAEQVDVIGHDDVASDVPVVGGFPGLRKLT